MGVLPEPPAPVFPVSPVAIEWCGACGAPLPERAGMCPACRCPVTGDPRPVLDARAFAISARGASGPLVAGCVVLDLVTALAIAGGVGSVTWASGARTAPVLVGAAVVGLLLGVVAVAACYRVWGRALGGLVCGVRIVDRASGLPGWPLVRSGLSRQLMAVDVRSGADPCLPMLRGWDGLGVIHRRPGDVRATHAEHTARATVPAGATMLVFDSGQLHWFTGSCLLGRSPVDPDGGDVLSLPDMSRRLWANHAQLVTALGQSGAPVVWLIDKGSAAGTWIERSESLMRAPASVPVQVLAGDRIGLGDYRFHLVMGQP